MRYMLIFLLSIVVIPSHASGPGHFSSKVDTLILTHKETGQQIKIPQGQQISCVLSYGSTIKGRLDKTTEDRIYLNEKGVDVGIIETLSLPSQISRKKAKRRGIAIAIGGPLFIISSLLVNKTGEDFW